MSEIIDLFRYHWKSEMDGGRIIHPTYPYEWYSHSDNVFKKNADGSIELSCAYNPREVKHWDGKIYHPTWEKCVLRSLESFDYGTFSADVLLPKGKNITCAFWLTGEGNWPPEIDVCEAWDNNDSYLKFLSWRSTTNIHYRDENKVKQHIGSKNISIFKIKDPSKNFVNYECIWKPDEIVFKANGKVVRRVKEKYCKMMTENVKNPEKGYKMNIILSCGVDKDPAFNKNTCITSPMIVKNLEYEPL